MTRHFRVAILFVAYVACMVCLISAQAQALTVRDVRFGMHPGEKVRLVLEMDATADFRAFTLKDPYRLVIDLPEFDWQAGMISRPAGSVISDLRQGVLTPGISRVVIDLSRPAAISGAFVLPRAQNLPDRLVVDFFVTSAAGYDSHHATGDRHMFGTLSVSRPSEPGPRVREASVTSMPVPLPGRRPAQNAAPEKPMIVIDPGHGGVDPGAISSNGIKEKNITIALSKRLRDDLLASGRYRVKLTRETDVYLKLGERVAFARRYNADLFVSIHADSLPGSTVRGASIYTLSEKASDAQTAKLAVQENRADLIAGMDLSAEGEDVVNILLDLSMRESMNQSKFLANTLVERMSGNGLRLLNNPHRYAGFAVLKAPDIPSILIEAGFISNAHEARALSQPAYRAKISKAVVKGIDAYFSRLQKTSLE